MNINRYASMIQYFEFIKNRYAKNLGLENFEIRIDEYSFKSPQANSFGIQIPLRYLEYIELNCNLLLANRNLFKDVGGFNDESFGRENFKVSERTLTTDDFMTQNNLSVEKIANLPRDNTRKLFSSHLSQIIFSFLVFHELGHVRQLNYQQKQKSNLIEFGLNEEHIFEQQAAETDADVFGINFFCDNIFAIMDNNWQNNPISLLFRTEKNLLQTSIYSIFLFFFLSNSADAIYNDTKQHPHPVVRLSYCMNFIQEKCILNEKIESKEKFSELMKLIIAEFDSALYFHFGLEERHHYFNKFKDPDVKKAASIIKQYIVKDLSLNFNRPYNLEST